MKLLIADDHPLFVDGLRNLLSTHGIEVLDTARDGMEAVDKARALHPDLILMDIQMPRLDGLAALRLIRAELPDVRVVMLTMSADDAQLIEAMKHGACGYLLKTQETNQVLALIAELERGEIALAPGLVARLLQEFQREKSLESQVSAPLSSREVQVLALVAQGFTYKQVGAALFLSEHTIKYHMGQIIERLHVEGRAQAIECARRAGIVK